MDSRITAPKVLTTIYNFPTMEPVRLHEYSSKYLYLPIRKDLLHRAVIFEGDAARQGTAHVKTRFEVHGSHRKIRPQKGTGKARLGTIQSPMLRGGGKSFGPRFRDYATDLPRKMYDLAWRTALSYRYKKGELLICEDGMKVDYPERLNPDHGHMLYMKDIFKANKWGKQHGRSLVITSEYIEELFKAMETLGSEGIMKIGAEVDVKDLLSTKRLIIEQSALEQLLREHQSDLIPKVRAMV
jgi:large subunit ribosomal protein L4